MKYLLVLIVVVVGLWLLLRPRRTEGRRGPRRDGATRMVQCAHCGVHLPEHDALADGRGELYCSDAHRLAGPR